MGVLAADPDAEREPTGRELRDRRELAGDGNRVAQRQQVEPDVHRQLSLSGEQGGRGDQPVRARSDEEAHVIADAQVVDARVGDPSERRLQLLRTAAERFSDWREEPDADASHRRTVPSCRRTRLVDDD